MKTHPGLTTIISILATIIAIGTYLVVANTWSLWPYSITEPVACTMEAKICSDGTSVGRTGPSCEFAPCPETIQYANTEYGFSVTLPLSWRGYALIPGTRDIIDIATGEVAEVAPTVRIRHPLWTEENLRQDIPIDIYTIEQWRKITSEEYSVGAAPIAPTELARNSRYVFALPARYNYAFPEGFEEVERILLGKPVAAFEPSATR